MNSNVHDALTGKAKFIVHPRTGHKDTEGKYIYTSTLSLTLAIDGAGCSTPHPGHFTPGSDPVPIV
jgi:hypothetical protein